MWLRALIQADTPPEVCIYEDVDNRDVSSMPAVQLYVAGPSCQPFSRAGTYHGEADPRGQHMQCCVDYIATKRPVAFVIENVPTLAKEFTSYFDSIVAQLRAADYVVKPRTLDTLEHGGLPQSRKRLYVVGIGKAHIDPRRKFHYPAALPHYIPLAQLLEHKENESCPGPARLSPNGNSSIRRSTKQQRQGLTHSTSR